MATINSAAICAAFVARLDGSAVGIRVLPYGTMTSDIYGDLPADEQARRALVRPRFDVQMVEQERAGIISERGGTQYLKCRFTVRSIYVLDEIAKASESALDVVRAQGTANLDAIGQALMRVEIDTAGVRPLRDAGVVSGCMSEQFSARLDRESFPERRIEFLSEFGCVVRVSPATS